MQQVLVNLIRNGIDADERHGRRLETLVIRSRRDGTDRVRVEVQDYGRGIEDTERIFEPFFTTKEDGMGMGLAICRSIVEAHDGRLWATKGDPKGTAQLHPALALGRSRRKRGDHIVFIVDDDATCREALCEL